MTRYWVFGGFKPRPQGGFGDLIGRFATEYGARNFALEELRKHNYDGWVYVVDVEDATWLNPLGEWEPL